MKKVLVLVLALLMVGALASAANKLSTMPVLLDGAGVRVLLDKAVIEKSYSDDEDTRLTLYIVIDNKNNKDLTLTNSSTVFDDWEVESNCYIDVKAGKKKKDTVTVHYEQAMIEDFADVNTMTVHFNVIIDDDIFDSKHPDPKPVSGKWLRQNIVRK